MIMAWVKIPADHHPLFMAAVPKDPRVTTLKMFGGIAAKANGQMFGGLFAKSFVVKLSEPDLLAALLLDGATVFDPMGNGRVMKDTILMPEETFGDHEELRRWLQRGLDHVMTLAPKAAKKPAAKKAIAKPAAKKPTAKAIAKPAAKQAAAKKPATPAKKSANKRR
jgi:TfoX/Sxy family transcriptional regulator of competence genes